MRSIRKNLMLLLAFLLLLSAEPSLRASAAARPVKLTKCQLATAGKIKITASASNLKKINGSKCYLFALSFADSGISRKAKPLASVKKAKTMNFSVKLNNTKASSLLYSRFVLASKDKKGNYKAISSARYLSNPKKAAKYTYKFPTASSKKGLQVSANMLEDAIDLNVQHSLLNIVFSDLLPTAAERNNAFSISYKYHGKTYWFRKALVNSYDAQLTALKQNNVVVSAVLLLGWRDDLKSLIYPGGREAGHSFYAWNTKTASAREQLQATLAFLGSRYGSSSAEHGRIVNWIVGNEVNNYNVYNYAGSRPLKQYAQLYADAFRMTYNTMTSIYANARVYISLDHLWNTRVSGSFTSRELLDAFASALKDQGSISWNLAFHPYGSPLTEPRFWANVNGQAVQSLSSPVISMKNIGILTSYIRQKYGSGTRIILSEQGYTSVRHIPVVSLGDNAESRDKNESSGSKPDEKDGGSVDIGKENETDTTKDSDKANDTDAGSENTIREKKVDAQKEQSAAIAYSYYLAEADSMIDSFIMNRHVDHQAEVAQGLDLGLWTTDAASSLPEWADEKKDSWQVFKYMDSNKANSVTADARAVIGIQKWADLIPGFGKKLYSKNNYASASLLQLPNYKKTSSIAAAWSAYGAVAAGSRSGSTFTAVHDNSRNRNSLWGFSQTFSKKLKFTSAPYFYTTLTVHGAAAAKAQVTICFYSGKNILECSQTIPCDTPVKLGVSLKKWKYRKAVQKIQVLISPVKKGWTQDAYVTMTRPVRGK